MSNAHQTAQPLGPPSKHQLALMIWVAVFPTLTLLNLTIGPWLSDSGPVLRTFVLATIAVPIVIYGLMPRLHRIRAGILTRRAAWVQPGTTHLLARTRPRRESSDLARRRG